MKKQCKHKNLFPNYLEFFNCPTPYCSGSEIHCSDCKMFISTCGCGFNNEVSGWPRKRYIRKEFKEYTNRNKC